jgi:hypothetical protein
MPAQPGRRNYLEEPVTIFFGEEDTADKDLSETRQATARARPGEHHD